VNVRTWLYGFISPSARVGFNYCFDICNPPAGD